MAAPQARAGPRSQTGLLQNPGGRHGGRPSSPDNQRVPRIWRVGLCPDRFLQGVLQAPRPTGKWELINRGVVEFENRAGTSKGGLCVPIKTGLKTGFKR